MALTILTATTSASYDVFGTTNMAELAPAALSRTNWSWLTRARGGATNFSWGQTNWCERYFQLGTMQDSDNDGLTDAYENLVSHTGTNTWDDIDSDNDGLSDAWEIANGLSPNTAECPGDIYEARIQSQNPYAWFKLNGTSPTPDAASLADARGGVALVIPTSPMSTTGSFTADLFDKAYGAFVFDDSTNGLETVRDVISGGTGNDQGSVSLLFRSLTGAATSKRYLFSQRAAPSTNEFAAYFDAEGLRLQIGGRTNVILQSNSIAYGAWYYLAITWDETRPSTNGAEVTWYLGRAGGTFTSDSTNIPDTAVVGSTNTVCLGCRRNNDGSWPTFRSPGNGALDQIAFWNRELTAGEITAQFNALPPGWLSTNFNWELMLPVNDAGQLVPNDPPHVVEHAPLVAGFQFVDCTKKYFYRGASNSMDFEAPWNGADTDTSSNSPRSELRETLANGDQHNWAPNSEGGTHTLQASCKVLGGTNKVVIGQIHAKTPIATNDTGAVPAVILSYNPSNGVLTVTAKYNPYDKIADQQYDFPTPVPLGETINYTLQMVWDGTNVTLNATVNSDTPKNINMTQPPYDPGWGSTNVTLYFKAGCYYPKAPTNSGTAKVTFSSLTVTPNP